MFDIIKSTIFAGGYKLVDIQHKIKKFYMLGDLTEVQMDELLVLASGGVSTDAERPETLRLIQTLAEKVEELVERIEVLESGSETTETPENPEQPEPIVYPEWTPWNGISKDYQKGAIVSHNGDLWQSVHEGQNVWEPGTAGTDALWIKYSE